MFCRYFIECFEELCRKGPHDDNTVGKFSSRQFNIFCILIYRLIYPTTIHSQVLIDLGVLAAKFIIRVILLLVFILKIQKALKFLLIQRYLYDGNRNMLRTIILWTFNNVISTPEILSQISFNTVYAECMAALLLTKIATSDVTYIA